MVRAGVCVAAPFLAMGNWSETRPGRDRLGCGGGALRNGAGFGVLGG